MFAELWHDLRFRLRALLGRSRLDRELQAEIDAHIAREAEALIRQGIPTADAWRRARVAFGSVEAIKAETREVRGTARLESWLQDLRGAVQSLRARPAATVGAVATLALGLGTLTVAFTATKAMRLDPLPYPDPDRLVMIWATTVDTPERRLAPTVPEYVAWRDRSNLFEAVATLSVIDGDLGAGPDGAPAETIVVQQGTASLFSVLGLTPELGRAFTDAEAQVESVSRVALIGRDLWQRRFGGSTDAIGRTFDLDGVDTTIVGVMPDGVSPQHHRVDVWTPIRLTPARLAGSGRGWPVIARLRPHVRLEAAQIETDVIAARLAQSTGAPAELATRVELLRTALFGSYGRLFALVEAMAVAVFLASCASVAGLFLMHVTVRRQALAVRAAIGAGRGRLARHVAMEGALVAVGGGAAALGIVWLALDVVLSSSPLPLPPLVRPEADASALLFLAAAAIVGWMLISLFPALHAWRVRPADASMGRGKHVTESPRSRRMRHALVVGQIGLATTLLVGAGLLATTLHRIGMNPVGGDPRGVVTFRVRYPPAQFRADRGSFNGLPLMEVSAVPGREAERVRQRIEELPGVASAAIASQVPFSAIGPAALLTPDRNATPRPVSVQVVSAGFFDTLRIPIRAGRDFATNDTDASPWGVIVNQTLADALGADGPAIGRTVGLALGPDERRRTVIGIVSDVKHSPLATASIPTAYLPFSQLPSTSVAPRLAERLLLTFVARTTIDDRAVVPAMEQIISEEMPGRLADSIRPLQSTMSWQVATRQRLLMMFGFFAITVTLLAVAALHGVIAQHFAEQARHVGVRIAFGAGVTDIWALTVGRLTRLLVPGITTGLLAAWMLSPAIADALWGISPAYVPVYVAAALAISLGASVATALLVRQVVLASPATILNGE